jgi:hypothetical protein
MINSSSPFYISLVDKSTSSLGFIVNAGDINSFILSTYKAKYDEIKGPQTIEERNYYARVGEGTNISKSFKFGNDWTPTFYTNVSCQVYITIPKIPAAFDYIPQASEGLRKDWWLKPSKGNKNFLNQFKIVKSNDEGFNEEKNKNLASVYSDDTDWSSPPDTTQFLSDADYSGKTYIKLADINLAGETNSNQEPKRIVKNFFRSNIIAPTRYIRYGSLNLRNLRLYVDVFGLISSSVNTSIDPKITDINNWKILDFFHQRKYDNFQTPSIFDFQTDNFLDGTIAADIDDAIQSVFSHYSYDFLRGETQDRNKSTKLNNFFVGRILAVYKETLGDQLKIFNLRDEIIRINNLVEISNLNTNNHSSVLGTIKKFERITEADALLRVFGWPEEALQEAKTFIEFINF